MRDLMPIKYPGNHPWPEIQQKLDSSGLLGDEKQTAALQVIVDTYTLDDAKRWLMREIANAARSAQNRFVVDAQYSVFEAVSWPIKGAEAAAYLASKDPASAPMLAAEAAYAGLTLDELAVSVQKNAQVFADVAARCAGNRRRHQDAVARLKTFEEVAGYDFSGGWPD